MTAKSASERADPANRKPADADGRVVGHGAGRRGNDRVVLAGSGQ
jgi:hypothetical protein